MRKSSKYIPTETFVTGTLRRVKISLFRFEDCLKLTKFSIVKNNCQKRESNNPQNPKLRIIWEVWEDNLGIWNIKIRNKQNLNNAVDWSRNLW